MKNNLFLILAVFLLLLSVPVFGSHLIVPSPNGNNKIVSVSEIINFNSYSQHVKYTAEIFISEDIYKSEYSNSKELKFRFFPLISGSKGDTNYSATMYRLNGSTKYIIDQQQSGTVEEYNYSITITEPVWIEFTAEYELHSLCTRDYYDRYIYHCRYITNKSPSTAYFQRFDIPNNYEFEQEDGKILVMKNRLNDHVEVIRSTTYENIDDGSFQFRLLDKNERNIVENNKKNAERWFAVLVNIIFLLVGSGVTYWLSNSHKTIKIKDGTIRTKEFKKHTRVTISINKCKPPKKV